MARALRATKAELSTLLSFFATAGLSASILPRFNRTNTLQSGGKYNTRERHKYTALHSRLSLHAKQLFPDAHSQMITAAIFTTPTFRHNPLLLLACLSFSWQDGRCLFLTVIPRLDAWWDTFLRFLLSSQLKRFLVTTIQSEALLSNQLTMVRCLYLQISLFLKWQLQSIKVYSDHQGLRSEKRDNLSQMKQLGQHWHQHWSVLVSQYWYQHAITIFRQYFKLQIYGHSPSFGTEIQHRCF